jgi:hypothetical protein
MEIIKDTTVFVLRDGITIYGEPVISKDWIIQRVAGKQNTYRAWVKGDTIGKSTGQNVEKGGVKFLEIECIACQWTRKNFLANWKIENVLGYIPISSIPSDVYIFNLNGTPLSFPETIVPESPANSKDGNGGGASSTDTVLWVLVFLLAMVAGYKALNRKRKN